MSLTTGGADITDGTRHAIKMCKRRRERVQTFFCRVEIVVTQNQLESDESVARVPIANHTVVKAVS